MTDTRLKNLLGTSIFLGQLSLVGMVVTSPFYGVDLPDAMSLLTVIAPLLGAYGVLIVRYFVNHRYATATTGRPIRSAFAIVTVSVPSILYLLTVTVFLAYALGWWNISIEETRLVLTSLEALFGIYLGIVVDALFRIRRDH